jgi:hypothetical protein
LTAPHQKEGPVHDGCDLRDINFRIHFRDGHRRWRGGLHDREGRRERVEAFLAGVPLCDGALCGSSIFPLGTLRRCDARKLASSSRDPPLASLLRNRRCYTSNFRGTGLPPTADGPDATSIPLADEKNQSFQLAVEGICHHAASIQGDSIVVCFSRLLRTH